MEGLVLAIKAIAERLESAPPSVKPYLEDILVELDARLDAVLKSMAKEHRSDYNLAEAEVDF